MTLITCHRVQIANYDRVGGVYGFLALVFIALYTLMMF